MLNNFYLKRYRSKYIAIVVDTKSKRQVIQQRSYIIYCYLNRTVSNLSIMIFDIVVTVA